METGNLWQDLQDLVLYNPALHIISHISAESYGTMLMMIWSTNTLTVSCTVTVMWYYLLWFHRIQRSVDENDWMATVKYSKLFTSILFNLLSAAEKRWSSFSPARSPISSMLLLLIFKTRRDFYVKKTKQWKNSSFYSQYDDRLLQNKYHIVGPERDFQRVGREWEKQAHFNKIHAMWLKVKPYSYSNN